MTISIGKISTMLYDKHGIFSVFIASLSNFHSDIPSFIFYGTLMSEILCILRSSSYVTSSYKKTYVLVT